MLQTESQIFPPTTGGGRKLAEDTGLLLLGQLPLDPRIGEISRSCGMAMLFTFLSLM